MIALSASSIHTYKVWLLSNLPLNFLFAMQVKLHDVLIHYFDNTALQITWILLEYVIHEWDNRAVTMTISWLVPMTSRCGHRTTTCALCNVWVSKSTPNIHKLAFLHAHTKLLMLLFHFGHSSQFKTASWRRI